MNISVAHAIAAALLFGISTPLAKLLLGDHNPAGSHIPPLMLAGLLYLGSGLGLTLLRLLRDRGWQAPQLTRVDSGWLVAAITFGGVLAPACLMLGLAQTSASLASLMLNLEAVLTALLAWVVFKEHTDKRMVLGMAVIVAGAMVLTLDTSNLQTSTSIDAGASLGANMGVILLALACLFWAIDNNLTRKIAAQDALFIAACKGWTAGLVNTSLGLYLGATLPPVPLLLGSLSVGFIGYGLSLVLFIWALRGLGTGRTGAYFSCAPFAGAAVSVLVLGEATTVDFWLAALLMALGVWLHLTERHEHEHEHLILGQAPLRHSHPHYPDAEHQHQHQHQH